MTTYLVVGATGQVGSAVASALARRGRERGDVVRGLIRRPDADLPAGVEGVRGDLTDIASLRTAVADVDTVVASASAAAPRKGDSIRWVEVEGYANLVATATTSGVRRFVYVSVPSTPMDDQVPISRAKRITERRLLTSPLDARVLRFPMFMESWLALVGSSLPLRGEEHATLERPYGFLQRYRRVTGSMVERRGTMLVPGPASARHAFISVPDVARLLVAAADDDELSGIVECGGPQILTWDEVATVYADVLGRPVRVSTTPAPVFAVLQRVISPFAPAAANILALNRVNGSSETPWLPPAFAARWGATPTITVRQFLTAKAALASA